VVLHACCTPKIINHLRWDAKRPDAGPNEIRNSHRPPGASLPGLCSSFSVDPITTGRFTSEDANPWTSPGSRNRFATEIDDRYIFPDTATQIAETLRDRAGKIPPDIAPAELAALFTQWGR
jgi:hypothetical protein